VRTWRGWTLLELLAALAVIALGLAAALPALARTRSAALCAAGARHMATSIQALRWRSAARATGHGLLFERDERGWRWVEARDGNGNGLRTAEVRSGVDPVLGAPRRLEDEVFGMTLGFPPGGPYPRIPPGSGPIEPLDDPIQIGASDLLAFGPQGTSSSGTIYLTDGRARLAAIVLFGATGRLRVWSFDPERGVWTQ